MEEFHELPPNEKLAHIAKFKESKYRSFGLRIIAQNYRNQLDNLTISRFSEWVTNRLRDPLLGTSPEEEIEKIQALSTTSEGSSANNLELKNFYVLLNEKIKLNKTSKL